MKYLLAIAATLVSFQAMADESDLSAMMVYRHVSAKGICAVTVRLESSMIAVPRPIEFCKNKRPGDLIVLKKAEIEAAAKSR